MASTVGWYPGKGSSRDGIWESSPYQWASTSDGSWRCLTFVRYSDDSNRPLISLRTISLTARSPWLWRQRALLLGLMWFSSASWRQAIAKWSSGDGTWREQSTSDDTRRCCGFIGDGDDLNRHFIIQRIISLTAWSPWLWSQRGLDLAWCDFHHRLGAKSEQNGALEMALCGAFKMTHQMAFDGAAHSSGTVMTSIGIWWCVSSPWQHGHLDFGERGHFGLDAVFITVLAPSHSKRSTQDGTWRKHFRLDLGVCRISFMVSRTANR